MKIRSMATGALAATLLGVLPLAAFTGSAAADAPAGPGDFDGDGHRDTAMGSPGGTVGTEANAGFVTVVYGGASGPDPARRQILGQGTGGVPGTAAGGNAFGGALTSADYDGDGFADLAVGAPGETVDGRAKAGTVTIVFGGPSGLTERTLRLAAPASAGGHIAFGESLARGDFSGDGAADLAVSGGRTGFWVFDRLADGGTTGTRVPLDNEPYGEQLALTAADITGDGRVDVFAGYVASIDGPSPHSSLYVNTGSGLELSRSYATGPESAAGDINGDGRADVVTRQWAPEDNDDDGGRIAVRLGTADGLSDPVLYSQATSGVPGTPEPGDRWGLALAVGDADGDGRADVAVGAPYEDLGEATDAGAVTMLFGGDSGLTTSGARQISQSTSGVPGGSEGDDRFGLGVSLTDATGDGRADLLAGAPGEDGTEGAVWVFPAAAAPGAVRHQTGALGIDGRNAGLTEVFAR